MKAFARRCTGKKGRRKVNRSRKKISACCSLSFLFPGSGEMCYDRCRRKRAAKERNLK